MKNLNSDDVQRVERHKFVFDCKPQPISWQVIATDRDAAEKKAREEVKRTFGKTAGKIIHHELISFWWE